MKKLIIILAAALTLCCTSCSPVLFNDAYASYDVVYISGYPYYYDVVGTRYIPIRHHHVPGPNPIIEHRWNPAPPRPNTGPGNVGPRPQVNNNHGQPQPNRGRR